MIISMIFLLISLLSLLVGAVFTICGSIWNDASDMKTVGKNIMLASVLAGYFVALLFTVLGCFGFPPMSCYSCDKEGSEYKFIILCRDCAKQHKYVDPEKKDAKSN